MGAVPSARSAIESASCASVGSVAAEKLYGREPHTARCAASRSIRSRRQRGDSARYHKWRERSRTSATSSRWMPKEVRRTFRYLATAERHRGRVQARFARFTVVFESQRPRSSSMLLEASPCKALEQSTKCCHQEMAEAHRVHWRCVARSCRLNDVQSRADCAAALLLKLDAVECRVARRWWRDDKLVHITSVFTRALFESSVAVSAHARGRERDLRQTKFTDTYRCCCCCRQRLWCCTRRRSRQHTYIGDVPSPRHALRRHYVAYHARQLK